MTKKPANFEEYNSTFPEDVQHILHKARETILQALPADVTERISYGIPVFCLKDRYVVYLSGWKQHISLYPQPLGDDELTQAITPYLSGKGTIKFPIDKPIPYDLIAKITTRLLDNAASRTGY